MDSTRAERTPCRHVLIDLPARVVAFLRAIGAHAGVRALMKHEGYTLDDDREGWRLLNAACAMRPDAPDPPDDGPARTAMAELQAWTARNLARLVAAVERLHPEEMRLFAGIDRDAGSAVESVVVVAKLLERVADREAGGAETAAVVATLARRGLTMSERTRLASVVALAQSTPPVAAAAAPAQPATHEADLVALYRWYTDWATTARAVVARKDYLVALGLSGRNKRDTQRGQQ
jgi:hypothetical protein